MDEIEKNIWAVLRKIETPYLVELNQFVDFLDTGGFEIGKKGIEAYLLELDRKKRIGRKGEEVSYSASWYNQHLKAVKQAVRYALDHSPELTNGQKYQVKKYLQEKKLRKVKAGISKIERVPTSEELSILIQEADLRLRLMIEFLVETGCRISEMLGAEIGQARRALRITRITILGKGERSRDIRCRTDLYDRIREVFKGKRYLFEHGGRQYSRISVTNRIKDLAEKKIGKSVTAHMLRHYRGTVLSEKLGISKAASELGHADIRTTKRFYDHTKITDEEFLNSLE